MEAENCGLQKGEKMTNNNYRSFFGLKNEPFGADININEILKTTELIDVKDLFDEDRRQSERRFIQQDQLRLQD